MTAPDYGLDPAHFLRYVIRPTLPRIGLDSPAAQVLLLGTALTESNLRWLDQLDDADKPGPAYGVYQMERATHDDIWANFLCYRAALRALVARQSLNCGMGREPDAEELWANLAYATAMCRVHYRRAPAALPCEDDPCAMAVYHKCYYNTCAGATEVSESVRHFEFAVRLCADT